MKQMPLGAHWKEQPGPKFLHQVQAWPDEHAGPPPHEQSFATHWLAMVAQLLHDVPGAPQIGKVLAQNGAPPPQQPVGHDVASQMHAPLLHR